MESLVHRPLTGSTAIVGSNDPTTAEARRKRASRGGKGRAAERVAVLWDEVRAVIEGVEGRRLTLGQGNTMIRGYNTLIDLTKLDIEQAGA
jgi:hypothetical protein